MATPTFFAAGTSDTFSGFESVSVPWPAGHQADDLGILVVEVMATQQTISPVGWTHFAGSPIVDVASSAGSKLCVLYRVATSSSEANASFSPDLSMDHGISKISVFRGVNTAIIVDAVATGIKATASTTATLPSVTTTVDGTMVVLVCGRPSTGSTGFGLAVNAGLADITEHVDVGTSTGNGGGFTLQSGTKATAGATGTSEITKTSSTTDTYLTVALVGADVPPEAYISTPSPLGIPFVLGQGQDCESRVSAPSMLAPPFVMSSISNALLVSAPSPLGTPNTLVFSDFTTAPDMLRSTDYYACDIVDGASTYRVKISSWQATLQLNASNYLQAVIPAVAQYMDILTGLSVAAEFVIIKGAFLSDGSTVENELARSTVSLRFDQGPQRHTCTMSGYSDAFTLPGAPTTVTDRVLRNVRSSSTDTGGRRFRCAIDWFLQPGRTAIYGEQTMTVSYINYYVTMDGQGDAYMDVGERI